MCKKPVLMSILTLCIILPSAQAATKTWNGTTSINWSAGANWTPAGAPATGDDVVITGSGANRPTNQDIANLSLNSLTFDNSATAAITITGQPITLTAAGTALCVLAGSGDHTLATELILNANQTWNIAAGRTLNVTGRVSDGTPELVGHWTFDEPAGSLALDSTKFGNHGALTNGVARVAGTVGSGALQFDATNDFVDVQSFSWQGSDEVTVSFWVNVPAPAITSFAFGVAGGSRFASHAPWSDSNIYWDYGGTGGTARISTSFAAYVDKWTHVALVSSGAKNTFRGIYLDGVLATSVASSGFPSSGIITGLQIGKSPEDANLFQKGQMDDFRIYRGMLSAAQIAQLNSKTTPTIAGSTLTKDGAGTLVLNGNSAHRGGTVVSAGTLRGNTNGLTGSITNNATVDFNQTSYGKFIGTITGTGSVIKTGAGSVLMTGSNSYTGTTMVNAGTLSVGATNALPDTSDVTVAASAILDLNGFNETIGGLNGSGFVQNGEVTPATGTTTGVFTGGDAGEGLDLEGNFLYAINFRGPGGANVRGATFLPDNATGVTLVAENEILAWHTPTYGTTRDDDNLELVMKSIRWTATNNTGIEIVGIDLAGLTIGQTYTLQMLFGDESLGRGFNVRAEGVTIVPNFSSIALIGGAIDRTKGAFIRHTFVATDTVLNIVLDGAGTAFADKNPVIQALTLEQPVANAALTLNTTNAASFSGTLRNGRGVLSVVKSGAGTQTLASANTYTGGTTVNAGTLLCSNSTGSATGTGAVAVNAGGTVGGTGIISGILTVTSGSISPGNGASGTLTVGSAIFNSASTLVADIGTVSDLLVVQGNLTVDGALNAAFVAGGGAGVYTLVTYTGTLTDNTLVPGTLPAGYSSTIAAGGGNVTLTLFTTTTMTVINTNPPSPTVFGEPVTFTAVVSTVAPSTGIPTGTLVFTVDGQVQPGVPLVGGVASLSFNALSVGAHTIQATYTGALPANGSNASVVHTVNQAQTRVVILSSANPSPIPDLTLSVNVAAIAPGSGVPMGSVTFVVDGQVQANVALVNGTATLPVSLAPGSHSIQVNYSGSTQYAASAATLMQNVTPSFVSLPTLTPNPALVGVTIVGTAAAGNTTITWDWGDGTTPGVGTSVSHVYATPGIFTATITATVQGQSVVQTITMFVGLAATGGGPGLPGVTGILVGGSGVGSSQGGSGKIVCNYIRREKTTYSGSVGKLMIPTTLTQASLESQPGILILGSGPKSQQFVFALQKNGKGKSSDLPKVEFSVKKARFAFMARREGLTDLTEALGAPQEFGVKKGQVVTLMVPATVQIGQAVFLAMTIQVKYQQINNGGKGALAK